jgi:hypothetical protein
MDLSIINDLNTNKLFTNLFVSQITVSILLVFVLIVKPYIIKRFALGEKISNIMKEYYINNSTDGLVLDFLYSIIINFCTFRVFAIFNDYCNNNYNNIFSLIIINNIVVTLLDSIIKRYTIVTKNKSDNIKFIKEWAINASKETYIWHSIYCSCVILFLLILVINDYDLFNPILFITIYLLFTIIHN